MSLIPCPECRSSISSAAPQCPRCGYPLRDEPPHEVRFRERSPLSGFLISLVLIGAGVYLYSAATYNGFILPQTRFGLIEAPGALWHGFGQSMWGFTRFDTGTLIRCLALLLIVMGALRFVFGRTRVVHVRD